MKKALVEMQRFEEEIKFKNILSEAGAILFRTDRRADER